MKRTKKEKKSRTPKFKDISDVVAWGPEPKWTGVIFYNEDDYQNALGSALNWYSYMTDNMKQKRYVLDYITANHNEFPNKISNVLSKIHERWFVSIGSMARIAMLGAPITNEQKEKLHSRILDIRLNVETTEDAIRTKPLVIDPTICSLISQVDNFIDGFIDGSIKQLDKIDVKSIVIQSKVNSSQLTKVISKYNNLIKEIKISNTFEDSDEISNLDPNFQIFEAYSHLTVEQGEEIIRFLVRLSDSLTNVPRQQYTIRKPRKKKIKAAEQLLKKFVYRQSDTKLKIQSVSPVAFLGSKGLVVYHVESRKACVFYASDDKGLQVSGSSIRNYDEEKSFCKIIRKPEDVIPKLLIGTRTAAERILDGLNVTPQFARSKINDDTLLLRVF